MTFPEDRAALEFYLNFAARFGAQAQPVSATDPQPESIAGFAGLLLTGGGDVDPSLYGDETKHEKTYGVIRARDEMELNLIPKFIDAGKPIVGICRGLQILTVFFGGRLHQHIPDVLDEATERHSKPKGYDCFHGVVFDSSTHLGAALRGVPETNSAHHQALNTDTMPKHLRIAARSLCGIVEAVECFDFAAPIIAVQWHPERLPADHPAAARLAEFLREAVNFQSLENNADGRFQ